MRQCTRIAEWSEGGLGEGLWQVEGISASLSLTDGLAQLLLWNSLVSVLNETIDRKNMHPRGAGNQR